MNILYITPLLPKEILAQVFEKDSSNYVFAPQKFHRNLVEGFVANGHVVKVLSYLPASVEFISSVEEDGIEYSFIPFKDKAGVKHLQIANKVCQIILHSSFKPDAIICDTLNVSMCMGALLARKFKKCSLTAIVTDLPDSVSKYEKSFIHRASSYLSGKYITSFDNYVLLTQQMNNVVNPKNRPFIIMEGVCDSVTEDSIAPKSQCEEGKRRLLYAGGRPSKDGVDVLIAAFKQIPGDNLELNIYGNMPEVSLGEDPEDHRIIYHGKTENSIIAKAEKDSYLLVNPRPTTEEYTKYSFPSKVMEYMASGIPMVTTRLSGIPEEYFKYVYVFEEYTVDNYRATLNTILSKKTEEHRAVGAKAKNFVLQNKNKIIQTRRIAELMIK